jgi:hypothetical protein
VPETIANDSILSILRKHRSHAVSSYLLAQNMSKVWAKREGARLGANEDDRGGSTDNILSGLSVMDVRSCNATLTIPNCCSFAWSSLPLLLAGYKMACGLNVPPSLHTRHLLTQHALFFLNLVVLEVSAFLVCPDGDIRVHNGPTSLYAGAKFLGQKRLSVSRKSDIDIRRRSVIEVGYGSRTTVLQDEDSRHR